MKCVYHMHLCRPFSTKFILYRRRQACDIDLISHSLKGIRMYVGACVMVELSVVFGDLCHVVHSYVVHSYVVIHSKRKRERKKSRRKKVLELCSR